MESIPKISTILYATDLGENTRPVFRQAIAQAKMHNASIVMVNIVEPLGDTARSVIAAYMPEISLDKMQKDGMKDVIANMKERIKTFCNEEFKGEDTQSLPVKEMVVIAGRPSEQILTAAETYKADMIVMGQSSKTVLGSKVMGSSARRVARLAKIPVLIVPNV